MRRWNGWGDQAVTYPIPERAKQFLRVSVGPAFGPQDAPLEKIIAGLQRSRLPHHPLINITALDRLRHARGQSLPDWIDMRSGRISTFPDGVAYPTTDQEVHELIKYARDVGATIIPYGGGTSVVGHINPLKSDAPVLTVDVGRLNRLRHFEAESHLATFEAGVAGPDLEAQLRARGHTLGHFPQSFEYSTLGGWVATHSCGQQSLGYGRIAELFAGGRLISPAGELLIPATPASAAGPDLRGVVLGSEGRLGILTQVTVRAKPLPEREDIHAVFLPDMAQALVAVRAIMEADVPLSMLRLSTPAETAIWLMMAGHEGRMKALQGFLRFRGLGEARCLALLAFTGKKRLVGAARRETLGILRKFHGVHIGRAIGRHWRKNRFRAPYLRNTLWELGYAVDTLETAVPWARVSTMVGRIESDLRSGLEEMGERVLPFSHLSHLYPDGASIYTTYLYRIAPDPGETLNRWRLLKTAASRAIMNGGGTISHQHGVGKDHLSYMVREKGHLGVEVIRDICHRLDPHGIMNPGKLVP